MSVFNQTYPIGVDGGSFNNTEGSGFFDRRIRYIRCEKNEGGGAACNVGIRATQGEYTIFLDSDDECLLQKLEKQIVGVKIWKISQTLAL